MNKAISLLAVATLLVLPLTGCQDQSGFNNMSRAEQEKQIKGGDASRGAAVVNKMRSKVNANGPAQPQAMPQ
jgi:hypothetical protein